MRGQVDAAADLADKSTMPHVLVTGATGFVGTNLVAELLRRGDRVRCLVRSPERAKSLAAQGAELVIGDLDQRDALARAVAGVDVVYHLAALTKHIDPKEMYRVNHLGTANVIVYVTSNPITNFIGALWIRFIALLTYVS